MSSRGSLKLDFESHSCLRLLRILLSNLLCLRSLFLCSLLSFMADAFLSLHDANMHLFPFGCPKLQGCKPDTAHNHSPIPPSHHQSDESFRLAEHVGVAHADGIDLLARDGLSVLAHMELLRVDHLGELLGPHAAVRGDEAIYYGFGKGHGWEFSRNNTT